MISKGLDLNLLKIAKSYRFVFHMCFIYIHIFIFPVECRYPCNRVLKFWSVQQLYLAGNQITSLASLPQLPNLEVRINELFSVADVQWQFSICYNLLSWSLVVIILMFLTFVCFFLYSFSLSLKISWSLLQWQANLDYRFVVVVVACNLWLLFPAPSVWNTYYFNHFKISNRY